MTPILTTLKWVPDMARGLVRDVRVRWACEEVGLPYAVELVDFDQTAGADYRGDHQPFGQVPVYTDDQGRLFESGAIVLRIAERTGQLLPADPAGRLRTIQWLIAALNSVEPMVMDLATVELFEADCEWRDQRRPLVMANLKKRLDALEAALGDKTWLDGDDFTVADLIMVTVLRPAEKRGVIGAYPRLAAYLARGMARPAFKKALADQLALYADSQPN